MKPQLVPSHVDMALAGGTHALHDAPHVAVDALFAQAPPQLWKPALQMKPQDVPSHVGVAFAGGLQGEHIAPHVCGDALLEQLPLHMW